VWAPQHESLEVVTRLPDTIAAGHSYPLQREATGYFSGRVEAIHSGALYSFRVDGDPLLLPDPASRFQPEGPHGPSQVVDPNAYQWRDDNARGATARGQVIYELHIGTLTPEGTYSAAAEQLAELARIGITVLELMPIAEFPGRFGWGYDGVDLWAPTRLYGTPDDLRRFVDRAHALGISVILDVVYNHLGPDGNYLKRFSPHYFTDRYENDWGEAINFDGPESGPVREFFIQNARYWIDEFHFDGLRLDATQSILDASERHVISEITDAARKAAQTQQRSIFIVAENEPQDARIVRPIEGGGYGCDALWNDDFHHSAHVALTGRTEAYYTDYRGTPQEFLATIKWGYLYQGQHYFWQKNCRGKSALDVEAHGFVNYIENHDQVANTATGARMARVADPALLRVLTGLLLLAPATPMLFQGQEFGSSAPFLYFADHNAELAPLVRKGRKEFLEQFPSITHPLVSEGLHDPADLSAFERCKLDLSERARHHEIYDLHCDLLKLRHEDPAFSTQDRRKVDGAILSADALLLRYFCDGGDRLVIVNFGKDLELIPAPEPLLAPPDGCTWRTRFCSESPRYGGTGHVSAYENGKWRLTARCLEVLEAVPVEDNDQTPNTIAGSANQA
jgi:maltooligosyltrehalose trehalohydrolase